jgi:DNA-binding Xre family transcriptional regulator
MLVLNLKAIFSARGIDNPFSFLVNAGLSRHTATDFLHNTTGTVKLRYLELICSRLNCTPNDLFVWIPDNKTIVPESHQLNALKKNNKSFDLKKTFNNIPVDQLTRIAEMLKNQENKNGV